MLGPRAPVALRLSQQVFSKRKAVSIMNNQKTTRWQSVIRLLFAGLTVATSLSLGMSTARGELLFSDSFEYPTGPLVGQGPPAGAPPGQTGWSFVSGDPQVSAIGSDFPERFLGRRRNGFPELDV